MMPGGTVEPPDQADWEATFVPTLRSDLERRSVGSESVVWSPIAPAPVALDPVATVMLDVIDGSATVRELVTDVQDAVGLSAETARHQVTRILDLYSGAGLLRSSPEITRADDEIATRGLFLAPPTPCSESASRLGTETLCLRFDGHTVRLACDSRRAARKLRTALSEHLVHDEEEDPPLTFVLTAPQGLTRTHQLTDRAGFVLSEGRGLDSGLHALASHLTALLPPPQGAVRIRARAVVVGDRLVMCLAPLLYMPTLNDALLERARSRQVDRLALDVDISSGEIVNVPVPWAALRELQPGPGHAGPGHSDWGPVSLVVVPAPSPDSVPPTPAAVTAMLAANGVHGSIGDLLQAAAALVGTSEIRTCAPEEAALLALLGDAAQSSG